MARWLEILAEFDFDVIHRPGRQHGMLTHCREASASSVERIFS